jgi:hypothetical protein
MTHLERVAAREHRGYPPRHAAFLELVMLHSGYFMRRQVVTFLRRRDGGVASDFLWHLVRRHAVRVGVGRRRAHLYQVFPKPLYAAIGEAENRNRRMVMPPMVIRKLMTLDLVLGGPSLTWLATEEEKIRHLTEVCHVPRSALSGTWYPGRAPFVGTVRYFVDKAPMRLETGQSTNPDSDRRVVRERQIRVVGPRFPDVYDAFRASGIAAIEACVSADRHLNVAHVRYSMAVLPHPYGLFGSAFEPTSPPRHDAPIGEENGR